MGMVFYRCIWLKRLVFFLYFTGYFLVSVAAAFSAADKDDIPEGLALLPRVGMSIEYGGFIVHQDNYTSQLRRRLEVDVLQYRRHIFYLEFDEKTFFGTPVDDWDFNLMKFNVVLAGYRYDFGNWYLGIRYFHECNNIFFSRDYTTRVDRERGNFYFISLEALSKAMRIGMKDRDINFDSPKDFEFLWHFYGSGSVNKTVTSEGGELDWLFIAKIRCDLLRYKHLVPYVEVGGEVLTGQNFRAIPSVEIGARYRLGRVDITPFLKWARNQEYLTQNPAANTGDASLVAKNYLLCGARIETLLDAETFHPPGDRAGWQLFPELHGNAGYAFYAGNPLFKAFGELALDLEVLRLNRWTVFFYTDMWFNTKPENFQPDKVTYSLQYGLTYAWQKYFVEGFVRHGQRLDAASFRGTEERFNQAGLRIGTYGMKPGHFNDGISFDGPQKLQWLNHWNAQASAAHFFRNTDWDYNWAVSTQVRWDALRWRFIIPYLQGDLVWLTGAGDTGDSLEYALESGVRLHGALDMAVYYRFQSRDNVLFFGDGPQKQNLFGVRVMF
jgi:hypothetical protein